MEHNENESKNIRSKLVHIGVFVCSMAAILAAYYFSNLRIDRQVDIIEDITIVNQIETVTNEDGMIHIAGWAFKLDTDAEDSSVEVFLRDTKTGETYWPRTENVEREDVNEYFLCEYDYTHCGFEAKIKAKKLGISNIAKDKQERSCQAICLRLSYKNNVGNVVEQEISTDRYLVNGQYCAYNPEEFDEPVMTGTLLDNVFQNGKLCFYRREEGLYVYQYERELYWIAQPWYYFEEDGSTRVQYHLETSQDLRLPEERLQNNWYFDSLGFDFEENEITTNEMKDYRVAKQRIPAEYAITYIWTGYNTNESGWIWKQYFRPYYPSFFRSARAMNSLIF